MSVKHRYRGRPRQRQSGLSIVELMVGVTIGLMIAAAAMLLMTGQLVENRRLLVETQMQQDLRASTDLMSRELRRAGANREIDVLNSVWYPGSPGTLPNSMSGSLVVAASKVDFDYYPGAATSALPGAFGFERQGAVVKTRIGGFGGLQDLTDPNSMRVTSLTPTLGTDSSAAIVLPCLKPCPDGTSACWPKYQVRRAQITLQAEAKADTNVKRSLSGTVRVRNDRVVFAAGNDICPP